MTTEELIKVLPFKDEFKDEILAKYSSLTPDQRFSVERVVWNYYYAVYQARLDKNMREAFERAKQNNEMLDKSFYERIRKQTDQELQKEFNITATNVDLSDARDELKKLLN